MHNLLLLIITQYKMTISLPSVVLKYVYLFLIYYAVQHLSYPALYGDDFLDKAFFGAI